MEKAGRLCEIRGERKFEWEIKDFLLLFDETDFDETYTPCESPTFYFSDTCWKIEICPSGVLEDESEGWISLFLVSKSFTVPITVDCSFSLKTADGESDFKKFTHMFDKKDVGRGFPEFIRRSELIERKSELLPSDVLTVICTLKTRGKKDAAGNEDSENLDRNVCVDAFSQTNEEIRNENCEKVAKNVCVDAFAQTSEETGVWKLQQNLREIFSNGSVSDLVLRVDDQEFKCHRCILAARSPVFLAMLTHETKEKNTGIVDIPDADPNSFSDFLNYLYTGNIEIVTSQNVVKLYTSADKYQVDELKEICVDYMMKNMTVDNFCDFLTLSLQYVEKDLTDACSQFFIENALPIILTLKWQICLRENPVACNELHIKYLQPNK